MCQHGATSGRQLLPDLARSQQSRRFSRQWWPTPARQPAFKEGSPGQSRKRQVGCYQPGTSTTGMRCSPNIAIGQTPRGSSISARARMECKSDGLRGAAERSRRHGRPKA